MYTIEDHNVVETVYSDYDDQIYRLEKENAKLNCELNSIRAEREELLAETQKLLRMLNERDTLLDVICSHADDARVLLLSIANNYAKHLHARRNENRVR